MKRDNLGLRVMLENEDEEKEARESNLGLRLMKKSDSLGMRLMKKDSLGMRLMKKNSNDQANLGLSLMKKEDPNLGLRLMKKSAIPEDVVEDDQEVVPNSLPIYNWFMRRLSLRSDPDLKSIDNYQPRGMRIMKRSNTNLVTRARM